MAVYTDMNQFSTPFADHFTYCYTNIEKDDIYDGKITK